MRRKAPKIDLLLEAEIRPIYVTSIRIRQLYLYRENSCFPIRRVPWRFKKTWLLGVAGFPVFKSKPRPGLSSTLASLVIGPTDLTKVTVSTKKVFLIPIYIYDIEIHYNHWSSWKQDRLSCDPPYRPIRTLMMRRTQLSVHSNCLYFNRCL